MLEWIENHAHLEEFGSTHRDFFVLMFWGSFSDAAERGLSELKKFAEEYEDIPVCALDVQKAKGVHKEFHVESVPTVLVMKDGKEMARFLGVESAAFYATQLGGAAPSHMGRTKSKRPPRVTVYTSPGCPPCGQVKSYLRENNIPFRAVDISRDERAARDIVRRSGQQAVPQIDINGRIVVGYDRARIANLLGIRQKGERTAQ